MPRARRAPTTRAYDKALKHVERDIELLQSFSYLIQTRAGASVEVCNAIRGTLDFVKDTMLTRRRRRKR